MISSIQRRLGCASAAAFLVAACGGGSGSSPAWPIGPPSAIRSTVDVSPASVPADGATASTVAVTVRNEAGFAIAGASVALAFTGAATIAPATATTDGSGAATFAVTSTTAGSGTVSATVFPGSGEVLVAQRPALEFVTPTYSIGGTVSCLTGDGLVLETAGQPDLAVPAGATTFSFSTRVPTGTAYAVGVKTQPSGQSCAVRDGAGMVVGSDVTGVAVDCAATWMRVSGGTDHTLAVTTNGKLYAWGSNWEGRLGDGTTVDRAAPVLVGTGIEAVSAGWAHTLVLTTDGRVFASGYNWHGELGDGTNDSRSVPVLVGTGFRAIAAGNQHSLALTVDGELFAWGDNFGGQLGDGTNERRNAPVLIGTGYASIAAGAVHSLAVTTDGELFAWGSNWRGELGDGTTTQRNAPVPIGSGYAEVAAGDFLSLALTTGGELHAWGANDAGQLGDGSTTQRATPVPIGVDYVAISAGRRHSLALTAGGELHAWGANDDGQLGDGSFTPRATPGLVGAGYTAIDAGYRHSLAITTDGQLFAWGWNGYGQLGDGSTTNVRPSPIEVLLPQPPGDLAYPTAAATCAVGVPFVPNVPTWTGFATSFTVTPALPAGLVLDPETGALSGTPSVASPTRSYVVTATGPTGSTTSMLTITVSG